MSLVDDINISPQPVVLKYIAGIRPAWPMNQSTFAQIAFLEAEVALPAVIEDSTWPDQQFLYENPRG